MKPVPSNGNAELKAKATELLVHLHGLRHENLNPLIGKIENLELLAAFAAKLTLYLINITTK